MASQSDKVLFGPFPSRMKGTCAFCSFTIHKYSSIFYSKQRRTKEEIEQGVPVKGPIALHSSGCADQWITKQATEGIQWRLQGVGQAQEAIDDDSPTEIPTDAPKAITAQPIATSGQSQDLLGLIASSVLPLVQSQLQNKLDVGQVKSLISDALAKFEAPMKRIELINPVTLESVDLGLQHRQFPDLLKASQARLGDGHRLNLWIGGPAGSGKSKAGEYVAKALGLDFAYTGSFCEAHKVFGYVSPIDGKYHGTPFRDAYENGKAFMFDDFDGSDPVCAIELLGMLANGHAAFPDGMVQRHKDFLCMVSANTFGHGATQDYVGRMKQDKALLNRFITFDWQYDEQLETATSGNAEWSKRVQTIRRNVASKGLKVLVTPRATYQGAALLAVGFDRKDVEAMVVGNSMTSEQWAMVK